MSLPTIAREALWSGHPFKRSSRLYVLLLISRDMAMAEPNVSLLYRRHVPQNTLLNLVLPSRSSAKSRVWYTINDEQNVVEYEQVGEQPPPRPSIVWFTIPYLSVKLLQLVGHARTHSHCCELFFILQRTSIGSQCNHHNLDVPMEERRHKRSQLGDHGGHERLRQLQE